MRAAASDDVQKLQEENASLRKRLAELEGQAAQPAATTTTTTTTTTTATGSLATDEGVQVLSPFQVTSDKDYGYLKTNAATATKIGMEIQKVPLNISVLSREFLDDTNAKSFTDLFRYSASASGDNRFAMRVPANEATPQGGFTLRGFSVNNIMRDGIFRYTAYTMDNVERIEIIKGPASVFFGQGYPGGVFNYISKRAMFSKLPTTFKFQVDDNGGDKVTIDQNTVLSKKAAFRIVGAWVDTLGDRQFEYKKGFNITPSMSFIPFDSGKVKVDLLFEYLHERFNYNDFEWIYSDFAGWKDAATNGTYASSTATVINTIVASLGNGLLTLTNSAGQVLVQGLTGLPGQLSNGNIAQTTTTPTLPYATYIQNKRIATQNFNLPAYTSSERGAYYTDKSGNRIHDESFNWTSRGSWADNEVKAMTASVEFSPYEWLSGRGAWIRDISFYNNYGNSALVNAYADGVHFNVGLSAGGSGYYRETKTALIDLVFKFDIWGTHNKILVGAQKADWRQMYLGKAGSGDVNLAFLPGAQNTVSNPDYRLTNAAKYAFGGVVVNQVIKDRAGAIKPVRQIYSNWDPGAEINPDISVFWQDDRNALDGYRPTLSSYYINWQGTMLDDRLTTLAGYREEKRYERWQDQSNNFPWYIYPNDMPQNPNAYPEDVWGNSKAYQQTIPLDQKGKSWMAGLSYAITKDINLYASYSVTFKFNSGNVGGFFPGPGLQDELSVYQHALDWGQGSHPGSYTYDNVLVTSIAQAKAIMVAKGAYDLVKNETGKNEEIGAKISTQDSKIVGTLSIFRGERSNQKVDDGPRQANAVEQYNGSTSGNNNLFSPSVVEYNRTNFRWRSTDVTNRIEGAEAEVIWTPIRNFQAVINGSYLWTARSLIAKNVPEPGSARYLAFDQSTNGGKASKIASDIFYGARLENVPEYRFNFIGKYTLTDGPASGLSLGFMMRYSSETVISRGVDFNPFAGGLQAGNYTVFDVTASYPWEILGYKLTSGLGIYNVTDKNYMEGTYVLSPPRNWVFTNTLKF